MKNQSNKKQALSTCASISRSMLYVAALLGAVFMTNYGSAQTTNAYDVASDPAYTAYLGVEPDGLSPGGQNGGFGFGAWTFTVNGNGGAFLQTNSGPSGASFDLWNNAVGGSTVAVRPFSSSLSPGNSFSVQLRLNSLDNSYTTNALVLQDASGNILFSYWHVGFEPNGATNGSYSDAGTSSGAAVGFTYNYQHFSTYTFTLNSATTYTFTDNTTGHSFTGVLSGAPIAQVAFIRRNGGPNAPGNGQDFQFDELKIVASAPPSFVQQVPAPGAYSASATNAISVQVVPGGNPINTGSITLSLDGSPVTPEVSTTAGVTTISYLPGSPLSPGTGHTVQVTLADDNSNPFTNTWHFTTGFTSLPATLSGPFSVSNATDLVIFTAAGDAWLGTNYQSGSSRTLYARFSMKYNATNTSGFTWGGFEFYQDNTERLLTGKSGASANWSVAAGVPDTDVPPATAVATNEWHTFVVRVDYSAGGDASAKVWLDPDFAQTEAGQPNPPLELTLNNMFNNVRLRCGFAPAVASYSNVIMSATSAGVGFMAPNDPQFQSYVPGINASAAPPATPIGVDVLFGTYGIGTNTISMTLDGNPVTPTFDVATNSIAMSYQPPSPFLPGSAHSVMVSLTDSNNTPYSTSWLFTVDSYPALPVMQAGPFDVTGGQDVTLWTSQNGWIKNNYGSTSTNTLYTRFSMVFYDFPQTTNSAGGSYGGLHFFQDNAERLLVGDAWLSTNWSADAKEAGEPDLSPVVPIVAGEWHTMVIKSVYSSNAPTAESIWLDPDFTRSLNNQPQPPLTTSLNNTFNQVRLRCGNGATFAEFTNIVVAATSEDLGFPSAVAPGLLTIQNGQLSWTGGGTLQNAPAVTGPWTDAADQSNPQALSTTNAAEFYRLRG